MRIADGAATATIENDRYQITLARTAELPNTKATLSVTAKQAYNSAPVAPASRDEVLVIKVKNLRIYINITQQTSLRTIGEWWRSGYGFRRK